MKKGIAVFLTAALLAGCLCACTGGTFSKAVTVEGAIFGGMSDDKITTEVKFNTKWLTKEDNRVYQPELAQFCALLSADSYFREKDYAKQRQNRVLFDDFNEPDYTFTSFLGNAGFTELEHYESYLTQEDPVDSNDSVTLTIGHQTVGKKYDVYAVVIRGCFSAQEWCSAFDPGVANDAYTELTGEHPEWTHKEHFKGIDVAANRALAYIEDFMKRTGDASLRDCILITGHSRGGGIANILGAYFEKKEGVTPYTYTFNSLGVTLAQDADSYETIFNIYDSGDFFTEPFPFAESSFVRYGKDMSVSLSESEEIRSAVTKLKGRDDYACISGEAAEAYRTLFAQRFRSLDMLCNMETVIRRYETLEDAKTARNKCLAMSGSEEGLGLGNLYAVGEITQEKNGAYSITIGYCGAALLRTYAMILAYGETACDAAKVLFAEDETGCEIASLLLENAAKINGAHLLVNSYVIAGRIK